MWCHFILKYTHLPQKGFTVWTTYFTVAEVLTFFPVQRQWNVGFVANCWLQDRKQIKKFTVVIFPMPKVKLEDLLNPEILVYLSNFHPVIVQLLLMWNGNHVKAGCVFLRCERRWGGLLYGTFFISGSTFFFMPSLRFCCTTHRLKRQHNLPCSVDLECECGKHMAPGKATVLLLLFVWSHPQWGMHRWDLSFGEAGFCSCRCREFTCRGAQSRKGHR